MSAGEPRWLRLDTVLAMHAQQLAEHGGQEGVRDRGLVESALARPRTAYSYGTADLFELAALYADSIANNHPFFDGNKRTALVAAALFLSKNGWELDAPEAEAAAMTLGLADKSVKADGYAQWLRDRSVKA
jgi:death on curing protein